MSGAAEEMASGQKNDLVAVSSGVEGFEAVEW